MVGVYWQPSKEYQIFLNYARRLLQNLLQGLALLDPDSEMEGS